MNDPSFMFNECRINFDELIVVGVSGGADSQCLLHLLYRNGFKVIGIYIDHQLRVNTQKDISVISALAENLGVQLICGEASVLNYQQENKISIEEAGRILRYQYLFSQALKFQAQAVAVGHHADDQVETILLHLIRGTGLDGLQGMLPRQLMPVWNPSIPLIRPLLDWWKSDILQYCNEFAIPYIFDETNENSLFTRNKIRNDLLPSLEAYNPQVKKGIWRMARLISLEKTVIDKLEKEKFEQCYYRSGEKYLGLYKEIFLQMEVGIQHRILRRGLKSLGAEEVGFELIHRILGYIRLEKPGKKFDLVSGLFLEVESDHIWMYTDQTQLPTDHWPQIYQEQKFLINHQIEIGSGWIISTKIFDISGLFSETIEANVDGFIAWIDFDKLFSKELLIKPKSKREYFQPLGMKKGSIKLKDYFINVKVPRRARKNWPLVYSKDQLVWVPGYEISEIFRVNKETQRAVQIKLRQAG